VRWLCPAKLDERNQKRRKGGKCIWIERDETGRPRCEHGWAIPAGRKGRDWWQCAERRRVSQRKHRHTEEWRAKHRVNHKRYMDSCIVVQVGGVAIRHRVPPEKKEELQQRIAGFKAQQAAERSSFANDL
jgi:hypothetical protein